MGPGSRVSRDFGQEGGILGFSAEPPRMCVATSRAKIGMVTFGSKDRGDTKYPQVSIDIWGDLIYDHL